MNNETQTNKINILYTRVENENLESLEHQESLAKNFGTKNGLNIHKIIRDKSFPGTEICRPGLIEVLHDVISGQVGGVIVTNLDRISTNYFEIITFFSTLVNNNCNLYVTEETVPQGLRKLLIEFYGNYEREIRSRRVKSALAAKKQQK